MFPCSKLGNVSVIHRLGYVHQRITETDFVVAVIIIWNRAQRLFFNQARRNADGDNCCAKLCSPMIEMLQLDSLRIFARTLDYAANIATIIFLVLCLSQPSTYRLLMSLTLGNIYVSPSRRRFLATTRVAVIDSISILPHAAEGKSSLIVCYLGSRFVELSCTAYCDILERFRQSRRVARIKLSFSRERVVVMLESLVVIETINIIFLF